MQSRPEKAGWSGQGLTPACSCTTVPQTAFHSLAPMRQETASVIILVQCGHIPRASLPKIEHDYFIIFFLVLWALWSRWSFPLQLWAVLWLCTFTYNSLWTHVLLEDFQQKKNTWCIFNNIYFLGNLPNYHHLPPEPTSINTLYPSQSIVYMRVYFWCCYILWVFTNI